MEIKEYNTEMPISENTKLLIMYPIYWIVSCSLMVYLIYNYLLFKLLFSISFVFYMTIQFIGNGLDNLIVKLNNNNNNNNSNICLEKESKYN